MQKGLLSNQYYLTIFKTKLQLIAKAEDATETHFVIEEHKGLLQ